MIKTIININNYCTRFVLTFPLVPTTSFLVLSFPDHNTNACIHTHTYTHTHTHHLKDTQSHTHWKDWNTKQTTTYKTQKDTNEAPHQREPSTALLFQHSHDTGTNLHADDRAWDQLPVLSNGKVPGSDPHQVIKCELQQQATLSDDLCAWRIHTVLGYAGQHHFKATAGLYNSNSKQSSVIICECQYMYVVLSYKGQHWFEAIVGL